MAVIHLYINNTFVSIFNQNFAEGFLTIANETLRRNTTVKMFLEQLFEVNIQQERENKLQCTMAAFM